MAQVVGVLGAAPAVPPREVEAEVARVTGMVEVMVAALDSGLAVNTTLVDGFLTLAMNSCPLV